MRALPSPFVEEPLPNDFAQRDADPPVDEARVEHLRLKHRVDERVHVPRGPFKKIRPPLGRQTIAVDSTELIKECLDTRTRLGTHHLTRASDEG